MRVHGYSGGVHRPARRERSYRAFLLSAGALVVSAALAAAVLTPSRASSADSALVPPALLHAVQAVPMSVSAAIGAGTTTAVPVPVAGPTLRGERGLPRVLYVGGDFCPFCAAQRWALVVALSRFGRFKSLRFSQSAADIEFPSTPTLTFHGSTYQGTYVDFTGVEKSGNVRVNGVYPPLDALSAADTQLYQQYDAPPYMARAGGIPFIDIANRYVLSGTGYSPGLLQGQSQSTIIGQLADPGSADARAIIGTANVLTAAICAATSDAPRVVCAVPAIQRLERALATASR